MKVRLDKPIPRHWWQHPKAGRHIVAEAEIRPSGHSKLRAKLIVVKSQSSLRKVWRDMLGGNLGPGCWGAVRALGREKISLSEGKSILLVDPRYFCVIGLIAGMNKSISAMEVVSHEAVHASFAFAKRTKYRNLWHGAKNHDEENIAYPAGRIAEAINRFMTDNKLY